MNDFNYYNEIVVNHRRALHQIPELGLELPKTTEYICNTLTKLGVEYEFIEGVHIFASVISNKSNGNVLLRADMDALDVKEETDLEFKSTSNYMHACGHDTHMAMQLTIIEILKNNTELCNYNVDVVFQAGEELLQGGENVVRHLKDHKTTYDKVFSTHIFSKHYSNSIELIPNTVMPSCDNFLINVESSGGHGATPEECISAIDIGCELVTGVKTLLATKLGLAKNAVVSFGEFNSGTSSNIIPGKATLRGTIRCIDENVRSMIKNELSTLVNSVEIRYKAKINLQYVSSTPSLYNDETLVEEILEKLSSMKNVHKSNRLILVSEDFAYYKELGKSVMLILNAQKNDGYPQHHNEYDINEDAMMTYCEAVYKLLCE